MCACVVYFGWGGGGVKICARIHLRKYSCARAWRRVRFDLSEPVKTALQ